MRFIAVVVVANAIAIALPSVALAQGSQGRDPIARGRALAAEYCGACHALGQRGDSPNASAPAFRTLGDKIELDDFARRLVRGLSSSHPDMPTFKFKPDDARALSAYLLSIQK